MGGSLPNTFAAWPEEQIHSPWFPLRRMVSVVVVAAIGFALSLASRRSIGHLLLMTSFPILICLAGVFAFRDRLRRKELMRYRVPEASASTELGDDGKQAAGRRKESR